MGAITTAVGTAVTLGAASTAAGSGIAGLSLASTIGAGVVGGGLLYAGSKLMKGLSGPDLPQQQQGPQFDPYAERQAAQDRADEETKRRRVAAAKNKGILSDPGDEAKLGTTGLLGAY